MRLTGFGGAALGGLLTTTLAASATPPLALPPLPPVRPRFAAPDLPPLPPARPPGVDMSPAPGLPASAVAAPSTGPSPAAAAPTPDGPSIPLADEAICLRLFASGKVVARALPPLQGTGGCGIAAPIEVSAVIAAPAQHIRVQPPVTIDCALGEAVADWVRGDLAPAFASAGSPLGALTGTSGYACRGRNGIAGAKLSEHGKGNAMDIGGFATANGRTIGVKQPGVPLLMIVKSSACARFATVLGPGSDGFHESHMHVDLETRRHGFTICHWDQATLGATARRGPR